MKSNPREYGRDNDEYEDGEHRSKNDANEGLQEEMQDLVGPVHLMESKLPLF
jgi:hypothetical protein